MRKQAKRLEWIVVEGNADWDRLRIPPTPDLPLTIDKRIAGKRLLRSAAVLLFLWVSVGGWAWRDEQARLSQPTANVTTTAQPALDITMVGGDPSAIYEQANQDWWLEHGRKYSSLPAATASPDAHPALAAETIHLQGQQATVRIVTYTDRGQPEYRQTRFYRQTDAGWQPTGPDAALWGAAQQWETPYFVFHFRQHDAAAVRAVAPRLDALYTTLHRNFGLLLTPGVKKLSIEVSVTQAPENTLPWFGVAAPLIVPSPARYLAPVALTDATLLEQALALPLLSAVLGRASAQYGIRGSQHPMRSGLRLWQMWEMDLPLAVWREEIVQWLYADLTATTPGRSVVLPQRYTELCSAHKLWLRAPAQLGIPLLCTDLDRESWYFSAWGLRDPPTHLNQIALLAPPEEPYSIISSHRGQTVALATLIEYAVATYGQERLPALVAGLGQYDSWETLIPAVYGVSSVEFEAGWQAYLTVQYGISPIDK